METVNLQNNRIDHVDYLRAFGIIFMIMAHIDFGYYLFHFIHAFHMPLFFLISGFFFVHRQRREYSFLSELTKKVKNLLLPYLTFGLFHYILKIIILGFQTKDLINLFTLNTETMPIAGALWFLTALFFASIIYFVLDRYIKNIYIMSAVILIIAIFGNLSSLLISTTLPLALSQGCVGVGFFHIGYLIKSNKDKPFIHKLLNLPWYINLILTVILISTTFLNSPVDMRLEQYGIIPLFWFNATFLTLIFANYARYLERHIRKTSVSAWLKGVGQNSIIYLSFNQFFILVFRRILILIIAADWLINILILALTLLVLYFVEKLFTCTSLKFFIGR